MPTKPAENKTAKGERLQDWVKKHLSDRWEKLNNQPGAKANGGIDKILEDACKAINIKTPNLKRVVVVTVLGKCGSRAKKSDLAIK